MFYLEFVSLNSENPQLEPVSQPREEGTPGAPTRAVDPSSGQLRALCPHRIRAPLPGQQLCTMPAFPNLHELDSSA